VALAGFLCVYAIVIASTGFRPVAALRLAIARDASMMGTGHETLARYLQISAGNLSAFLIGAGFPSVLLWLGGVRRALRRRARGGLLDVSAASFAAALLLVSFSTLFTLETERIWIGLIPFVAILAARLLEAVRRLEGDAAAFRTTAVLLSAQILLFESFLNTRW
jgi:hypothetical protein